MRLLLFTALFLVGVSSSDAADNLPPYDTRVSPDKLPTSVLIDTTKGAFAIEFYRNIAPATVLNFVYLADKGLLQDYLFGSVRPGEVVQGGDPPSREHATRVLWTLPAEFSEIKHVRGTVGMRRSPSLVNPGRRSHPTEFYIALTRYKHLDGLYTVFGRVSSGMDVVDRLEKGDKILKVSLPKGYNLGFEHGAAR